MLQQDEPDDYVIATGKQHTVRDFVNKACELLDIDIIWKGTGANEVGIDKENGVEIVKVDPRYYRPTEVETLLGDPSKAKNNLSWEPKISFHEMVNEMVSSDLKNAEQELMLLQRNKV